MRGYFGSHHHYCKPHHFHAMKPWRPGNCKVLGRGKFSGRVVTETLKQSIVFTQNAIKPQGSRKPHLCLPESKLYRGCNKHMHSAADQIREREGTLNAQDTLPANQLRSFNYIAAGKGHRCSCSDCHQIEKYGFYVVSGFWLIWDRYAKWLCASS